MKLMLHINRKDFRHLRVILGTWWSLVILIGASNTLWPSLEGDPETSQQFLLVSGLFGMVELLVRAAVISKLIHSDSVVGSTAFWLSCPIPKTKLLASKAIFLALLVVLPKATVESALGGFGLFEQSPPPFLEALLSSMVWITILTIPAVLTRNLAGMAALAGIGFVALSTGSIAIAVLVRRYLEPGWTGSDISDEWAMLFLFLACGAVICHQYLTRRTMRSKVLAFLGIPIVLLVWSGPWFWRDF